jgi:hypothetical protein
VKVRLVCRRKQPCLKVTSSDKSEKDLTEWVRVGYTQLTQERQRKERLLKGLGGGSWAMVVHAFNPSTWEAEAGGFLSSRPAWSTEWVPGQPGLYRETLSQKQKKNKKKTKKKKKNGGGGWGDGMCLQQFYQGSCTETDCRKNKLNTDGDRMSQRTRSQKIRTYCLSYDEAVKQSTSVRSQEKLD